MRPALLELHRFPVFTQICRGDTTLCVAFGSVYVVAKAAYQIIVNSLYPVYTQTCYSKALWLILSFWCARIDQAKFLTMTIVRMLAKVSTRVSVAPSFS